MKLSFYYKFRRQTETFFRYCFEDKNNKFVQKCLWFDDFETMENELCNSRVYGK